ncbi:hypothetical protein BGW38_006665 [Lunasporangiospora selenospora]|uniref:FHA domain-containing protein n=1 Tax=Lunasporangiospora selenospora TaxID=979761 RepID=A0A9P6FMB4_9FUNG|nr:hypothetical protein BGW38_006665 [Lunasporangiospora selenospora]
MGPTFTFTLCTPSSALSKEAFSVTFSQEGVQFSKETPTITFSQEGLSTSVPTKILTFTCSIRIPTTFTVKVTTSLSTSNDFRRRGGGAGPGPRSGPNKGQRGPKHESTFRAGGPAGSAKETWGRPEAEEEDKKPVIPEEEKEKPNFGLSGALAAETNKSANGTLLKYNEPAEARKPSQRWRLYVFKGDKEVVDIPLDHPSCSKQHAVLQFRQVVENDALGQPKRSTKPFIIDLESANGTFVNGSQIPSTRYYELKVSDMIKFGASSREFVLLHESA